MHTGGKPRRRILKVFGPFPIGRFYIVWALKEGGDPIFFFCIFINTWQVLLIIFQEWSCFILLCAFMFKILEEFLQVEFLFCICKGNEEEVEAFFKLETNCSWFFGLRWFHLTPRHANKLLKKFFFRLKMFLTEKVVLKTNFTTNLIF